MDLAVRRAKRARLPLWALVTVVVAAALLAPAPAAATRLCLHRPVLPLADGDPRVAMLEAKIARVFKAGSFAVTRSDEVQALGERIDAAWGAIYDPYSGRVVSEKAAAYEREMGRGFREELGCDARIAISVVIVRAPFSLSEASWDGVSHQIMSTGRVLLGGMNERGWVAALSLWIRMIDPEGNDIAFRSGGIEPLVSLAVLRDKDRLPEDRWLRDSARLDRAIRAALGPGGRYLRDAGTPGGRVAPGAIAWPGTR